MYLNYYFFKVLTKYQQETTRVKYSIGKPYKSILYRYTIIPIIINFIDSICHIREPKHTGIVSFKRRIFFYFFN